MAGYRRAVVGRAPFVLLAALLLSPPAPSSADLRTVNAARADVSADVSLAGFYEYGAGDDEVWSQQSDFAAGSTSGTSTTLEPGLVTLDRTVATDPDTGFAAWWDPDWIVRECFTVSHTQPGAADLADYPVRVTPTIAPGSDLRAVAADDATVLPHYVNGPDVWVKVDLVPAGGTTHVCLYSDNPAAGNTSDATAAVVSALVPSYVTVNERANGRNVTVVSHIDGNVVSNGTQTVYGLDAGDSFTFTSGNTPATTFSVLGPISSRVIGQTADTLIPLAWAGNEFIFPTTRGTQRISVHAPYADATVTVYRGAAGSTVTLNVPAGTTAHTNADAGTRSVIVTSDQPILAAHFTTNGQDAIAGYPSTTADLFGVPSTRHYVSASTDDTSVTVYRSDGNTYTNTNVDRFQIWRVTPNGATFGNGPSARLSGSAFVGSIQQADANGVESTTFLPEAALSTQYYLPTQATYVAFACPIAGTVIEVIPPVGAPTSLSCTSPGLPFPGKARAGALAAGTLLRSSGGEVFYAYYQDNATVDETNLTGPMTGAGSAWPGPAVPTLRAPEGTYRPSGTWTSAEFDTAGTGVFGLFSWTGTAAAGTTLRFQVATSPDAVGPFIFVGPDGTAGTFYEHPFSGSEILPYVHDGNRYVQVRALLDTAEGTATPRLDTVTVEWGLPTLAHGLGAPGAVTVGSVAGAPATHHLIRVRTGTADYAPSDAALLHRGDGNLANVAFATLGFDSYTAPQIQVSEGTVTLPAGSYEPFSPPPAYSIILEEETATAGETSTIEFAWRMRVGGSASVYVDRLVEVSITS